MRLTRWNRQLVPWGFGQRRLAKRRATRTEELETRFHGISGACSRVAATTALRKRDLTLMLLFLLIFHCWASVTGQCGTDKADPG